MDRALKERVIGAVVLVVIAVLVVPVFLDGPSSDAEMISEPVTLPGQNGQPRTRQTIVLERDRDQPVPVAARQDGPRPPDEKRTETDERIVTAAATVETAGTTTAEPEKAPVEEPERPSRAEDEAPASAGAPAGESTTGMWAVQIGSFSNKANADRLAATLRDRGYAAFLSEVKTDTGALHRVRVGPQKDRDSAEEVGRKLRADGLKGQVVPHP